MANGNPLIENPDIEHLRLVHKEKIAELGYLTRLAPPIATGYVVEHAKTFWLTERNSDSRDVAMHAVFLTALNCDLRFAEVSVVKLSHVSVTLREVKFSISQNTKKSISYKEYCVKHWPGSHIGGQTGCS